MTKELRERYWKKFGDWKNTPHDMIQKFYEQEIIEAERRGIATCTNLIPEQKEIPPLGGDAKFYAGYNAGLQLTRDNFDKYFSSLK